MDLKKINLSNKSKLMQGLLAGIVGFAIALIFSAGLSGSLGSKDMGLAG